MCGQGWKVGKGRVGVAVGRGVFLLLILYVVMSIRLDGIFIKYKVPLILITFPLLHLRGTDFSVAEHAEFLPQNQKEKHVSPKAGPKFTSFG